MWEHLPILAISVLKLVFSDFVALQHWEELSLMLYHFWRLLLLLSTSVVSDSGWPHRRQPTRLPRPWDSPGKNTGVDCHFLLQCMKVKSEREVAQSSNPINRSYYFPCFTIWEIWVIESKDDLPKVTQKIAVSLANDVSYLELYLASCCFLMRSATK